MLAAELRRRVGVRVRDLGPMRAARREALLALGLTDRRFGYPLEMVVRAAEAGWRIAETAVPYYPSKGKSKVTGTVGGTRADRAGTCAGCSPRSPRRPASRRQGGPPGRPAQAPAPALTAQVSS